MALPHQSSETRMPSTEHLGRIIHTHSPAKGLPTDALQPSIPQGLLWGKPPHHRRSQYSLDLGLFPKAGQHCPPRPTPKNMSGQDMAFLGEVER